MRSILHHVRPKVYLAGPITGESYAGCTDWREDARSILKGHGIEGLSPMRAKEYLEGEARIEGAYDVSPLSTAKGITTRDRWDCQRADVVLVNFVGATRVSVGTCMELAWADAARVPIVVAMENPTDTKLINGSTGRRANPHDHPMVREVSGFIVPTLDEALDVVVALLKV